MYLLTLSPTFTVELPSFTDVNDWPPVFVRAFYTVTVMPNASIDTPIIKVKDGLSADIFCRMYHESGLML